MKRYLYLITTVLAFAVSFTASAKLEGQAFIDSLLKEIPKHKEDTTKAFLLSYISMTESNYDPNAGLKYGNDALQLSEKLDWKKGMAESQNSVGANYMSLSNTDKAIEYFNKAYKINEELGSKKRMAQNLGNIALIYELKSNYVQSLEYLFRALKIFEELKDKNGIAIQYGNIGNVYDEEKNLAKALYYDSIAVIKYRELNDRDGTALQLGNIGNIYDDMGLHEKALDYDKQALQLYEELHSNDGIARNIANIGVIYNGQKKYNLALAAQFRAYRLYQLLGNQAGLSRAYINIGEYYWCIVADSVNKIQPDSLVPSTKQACLKLAKEYADKAIAIDKESPDFATKTYDYAILSQIERMEGNYKDALDHYILHADYKDSVFNMDSKTMIEKLTTEREVELKNKQIKIDELEVAKKRNERGFYIAGIIGLLVAIFFVLRNYRTQIKSNKLLSIEKQKSEDLLLNILPSEVAEELKNKGSAEAKLFNDVSVIFTDFVNFTGAGEKMKPQELVDELHTCFKTFDDIIGRHHLEKIKTIGDAYLAVGGLPLADPAHAEHVVEAAKEIRDYILDRKKQLGDRAFDVRIGIHSGSVVAGIVGVKKFAYDIWGDTVNTAARMEQNSQAGKINISETTYEIVKDKFSFTYRGEIDAKNKGMLKMYYVD